MVREVKEPTLPTVDWGEVRKWKRAYNDTMVIRVKNNKVTWLSCSTKDGALFGYFDDFIFTWSDGHSAPGERGDKYVGWLSFVSGQIVDTAAKYYIFDNGVEFSDWFRKNTHLTF